LEVAFFPTRYNTWDCLASIYQAATDDPDCDAYCVPIPMLIYDPDTNSSRPRDFSALFSRDIPITKWREYNVRQRKPDIAFIDLPFNWSTPPAFWAKTLKRYCGKVVYVPYYVCGENGSPVPGATMQHNVRHADYVITESETIRRKYIDEYEMYDKKYKWKGKYGRAEDKFVALGSPKYDSVSNAADSSLGFGQLPQSWQKAMTKDDGSRKKIVLYNTHYRPMKEGRLSEN